MLEQIELLSAKLTMPLPGEEVQFRMAPKGRLGLKDLPKAAEGARKSAVLLLLFPEQDKLNLVFIERPVYQGVHSGQVAFPGGKFEPEDLELHRTALRESNEEVGIPEEEVELLGQLSDVYITPSNFLVRPFIGFMNKKPEFIRNEREVNSIFTCGLDLLLDPNIKGEKFILNQSIGMKIKTPYYEVEGFTIWGATAMMISELNALTEQIIF